MPLKEKWPIFITIFLILGIVIGLQSKSIFKLSKKSDTVNKIERLRSQLDEVKKEGSRLKADISSLEKKSDTDLKSAVNSKNDSSLTKKLEYLENLKIMAGLTDVKGNGVIVKLDDATVRTSDNPNENIIHDSDMIKVVNELKKSGAQAISINGERLIATSEQVCAGPTIRINMNRYATPFIISAIGNPDIMYDDMNKSDIMATLISYHIKVSVDKSENLLIPKYSQFNGVDIKKLLSLEGEKIK